MNNQAHNKNNTMRERERERERERGFLFMLFLPLLFVCDFNLFSVLIFRQRETKREVE